MWATDYRVIEDFCKPYNVCMDFKADYKIPGDQEGSGLQSVGCREGWWGEELTIPVLALKARIMMAA